MTETTLDQDHEPAQGPDRPGWALALSMRVALFTLAFLVLVAVLNRMNTFVTIPFTGDTSTRAAKETPDVREVYFPAADGTRLYGWVMGKNNARYKVIFCKGQGGYLGHLLGINSEQCRELDMQVLVFDYRGYNLSAGIPGEAGTYSDARGAWIYATGELGWQPSRILIWGQSLGGAVAIKLCCDLIEVPAHLWPEKSRNRVSAPAGLVLECPFENIEAMARYRMGFLGMPQWLAYCGYDNLSRAPKLTVPVFHVHGQADEIVPFSQSTKLHAAIAGPKFGFWPEVSKHNDIWATAKDELRPALIRFFHNCTTGTGG